ncbi:MAG: hypothetical protein HY902_00350 [Deltaproteobacteria bacterium]|nr:hypothetical protein [Deltaproteobacteria bacterium]
MHTTSKWLAWGVIAAGLVTCGGPDVRVDETTVAGHEAEARRERVQARSDKKAATTRQAHANAHELAAVQLAALEDAECRQVDPASRSACPVLLANSIDLLPNGIRIRCRPDQIIPGVHEMRCHLAYAKARGFDAPDLCPYALPGVRADPSPRGEGIDLTADDPASVRILQALQGTDVQQL